MAVTMMTMVMMKRENITVNMNEDVEKLEPSYTVGWENKTVQLLWKTVQQFSKG